MSGAAASIIMEAQGAYEAYPVLAYALIYVGTILFGNVVVLGATWLAWIGRLGTEGLTLTLVVILVAHLSGDMLWYWLGRLFSGTPFGRWLRHRLPPNDHVGEFLDTHRVVLVASGKLLLAPVIPLLFLAGWYKMPFGRYLRVSLVSSLIWFPVILGISYGVLTGATALSSGSLLITVSVLIAFLVGGFFVIRYAIMPRIQKWWEEDEESAHAL